MNSGVAAPKRVVALTFAPEASRSLASSTSSFWAAQCRAVLPSPCAPLTSALSWISRRTASRLPCWAASATRVSAAYVSAASPRISPASLRIARPPDLLNRDLSGAVPDLVHVHADLANHRQQNIRHGRVVLAANMLPALDAAVGVAGQENRHALVIVRVGIAQRAAVQNQRMIQQVAVAVGRVLQFFQKIRDQADVIA